MHLWEMNIYYVSAFECILKGEPITIPTSIDGSFMRFAEEIAEISYSQSETFSSVRIDFERCSVFERVFNVGRPQDIILMY